MLQYVRQISKPSQIAPFHERLLDGWLRLRKSKLWRVFVFLQWGTLFILIGCLVKANLVFISPNGIPTVCLLSGCAVCSLFSAPATPNTVRFGDHRFYDKTTRPLFYLFGVVVLFYVSALIFLYFDNRYTVPGHPICSSGQVIATAMYLGLGLSVCCCLFFCFMVGRQSDEILTGLNRYKHSLLAGEFSFVEAMQDHQVLLKEVKKMSRAYQPWMCLHLAIFVTLFCVYSLIWVDLAKGTSSSQGTHLVIYEAFCPSIAELRLKISMVWYELCFTFISLSLALLPIYHMTRIHTTASRFSSEVSSTVNVANLHEETGTGLTMIELDLLLRHIERTVDDRWVIHVFSVPMYHRVFSASVIFGVFNLFRAVLF